MLHLFLLGLALGLIKLVAAGLELVQLAQLVGLERLLVVKLYHELGLKVHIDGAITDS
jgi:hypothetical protein